MFETGLVYVGDYSNNLKEGYGIIINKSKNNRIVYEGQFQRDMPHGKGKTSNK